MFCVLIDWELSIASFRHFWIAQNYIDKSNEKQYNKDLVNNNFSVDDALTPVPNNLQGTYLLR